MQAHVKHGAQCPMLPPPPPPLPASHRTPPELLELSSDGAQKDEKVGASCVDVRFATDLSLHF